MKKIIVSLLAVCILALPACGEITQNQFDIGEAALLDEDYESAIDAFTQAIEDDPDLIEAYIERAKAYIGLGETEENLESAQKDYKTALELDEENVDAELGLADVYIREGEYDAALEILEEGEDQSDGDEAIEDKIAEFDSDKLYDSSGNVRRESGYDDAGGLLWYHEFTYDEENRKSSVTSFDSNGNQTGHVDLKYDDKGQALVSYITEYDLSDYDGVVVAGSADSEYLRSGTVSKIEYEYEYDDAGNCIKMQVYNDDGSRGSLSIYEYDSKGNKIRTDNYNAEGELYLSTITEYDENGNSIKSQNLDSNGEMSSYEINEYDSDGNRTKTSYYDDENVLTSMIVYNYDENGKQVGHDEYNGSGELTQTIINE